MSRRWELPAGVPRKGWIDIAVTDLKQPAGQCDACGNIIRFVHELVHDETETTLEVGVDCAGHLTENYAMSQAMEKAAKRKNPFRDWRLTFNQNWLHRKLEGVVVFRSKFTDEWLVRFDEKVAKDVKFKTALEAVTYINACKIVVDQEEK